MGDRSASITVTSSVGLFAYGSASGLVNGSVYEFTQWFSAALSASSHWIKFDFGAPRKITEAKWFQSGAASHGSWKWQGSNDDSSYTDVGTSFTLGTTTPQTHTSLNGNTVAYRYWKLVGVSGTTSSSPYIYECEFKLNDGSAVSATSLSVPGQASFTGTAQFSSLPILPRQTASTFLGAPASASDIPAFRSVTRADIYGSLNLTPSDMPSARFLAPLVDGQTLSSGDTYLQTGTATTNNICTVSGTGNITFTMLYAGTLHVYFSLYKGSSSVYGCGQLELNGTKKREFTLSTFDGRVAFAVAIPVAAGDVVKLPIYAASSVSIDTTGNSGTLTMCLTP